MSTAYDMIQKITVFGATGMIGKPVVRQLVKAGFLVRAMVRDTGRAAAKLPSEVELVEGDLQNRKEIEKALVGADAVYLNLSTRPDAGKYASFIPERDGLERVLSVVSEYNKKNKHGDFPNRKIRRIAMISSLVQRYQGTKGFSWWVFEIKKWAIKALKSSDVPVTIFYPSCFMETIDQGGVLQGNRLMQVGKSYQPIFFISGDDYGRMVARAFHQETDENQEYDIQGKQGFTMEEAAIVFLKNYRHGPLKITFIPLWLMKVLGIVNGEIHYISKIMKAMNCYAEQDPDEAVWKQLGHPKTTLEEYTKRL